LIINNPGLYKSGSLNLELKRWTLVSRLPFVRDRVYTFNDIHEVTFGCRAVGGHTSAYEEGNTDYSKSVILITDQTEIRLFEYLSRSQEIEQSVMEFVAVLKQKLKLSNNF
jgi:hypothetical protein